MKQRDRELRVGGMVLQHRLGGTHVPLHTQLLGLLFLETWASAKNIPKE